MTKTTFEYLVKKQQSRYNRALDKVAKEKERMCILHSICKHTYGIYKSEYNVEPIGNEPGYALQRTFCNLCHLQLSYEYKYGENDE